MAKKEYELLKVTVDKHGEVDDLDHIAHYKLDAKSKTLDNKVKTILKEIGYKGYNTISVGADEDMGIIDVYDKKNKYIYQFRD